MNLQWDPDSDAHRLTLSVQDPEQLSTVRAMVGEWAKEVGIPSARRDDVLIGVTEATVDVLQHTHQPAIVSCMETPAAFVCEIAGTDSSASDGAEPNVAADLGIAGIGLVLMDQSADRFDFLPSHHGARLRLEFDREPNDEP